MKLRQNGIVSFLIRLAVFQARRRLHEAPQVDVSILIKPTAVSFLIRPNIFLAGGWAET